MNFSMLESAEEYATEYFNARIAPSLPYEVRWVGRDYSSCTCTGGLPMMKPMCPRHGHLVRSTR